MATPQPEIPSTMKAAIRTKWTSFDTDLVDQQRTPSNKSLLLSNKNVLVKVHAAALNPVDYKLPKLLLGSVLGLDVCGTVVAVPKNCNNLQVGDVVTGVVNMGFSGALAEYAVCPAAKVTKVPMSGWSLEEAAALPIACGTAMEGFRLAGLLQPLKENPDKPPISSLLVIGASGGCGLLMLQLAKGMGIERIVGICSSKNTDLCKANGATEIIAYDNPESLEQFYKDNEGKIELIYDAASYSGGGAGEDYCDKPQVVGLLPSTSRHSRYIMLNCGTMAKAHAVTLGMVKPAKQSHILLPSFGGDDLKLCMDLLTKAKVKPIVDTTYPFTREGITEAYNQLQTRRAKGKIVISISSNNKEAT